MMRQIASTEAEDIPPEGGRFVKSLNSHGASWVVTDFYPDSETVFTFRFNDAEWDVTYENYYGTAEYDFRFQRDGMGRLAVYSMYGISLNRITWAPSGDHVFVMDCQKATFTIDDGAFEKTGTPLATYVRSNYPLLLFAKGKSASAPTRADVPGKLKLYEASVMQNKVLTHKWRPIIDGNGVACMYDTVTQKCLYNAGTGTFTYDE